MFVRVSLRDQFWDLCSLLFILTIVDSGKGFLGNQVYVLTPISIIRYGKAIHGPLLSWIENYLLDRKQRVVINGCCSDWLNVCGHSVP
jgi:hypothetical protein